MLRKHVLMIIMQIDYYVKKINIIINLWFYQMKRIDQGYKKNFCTGWQQSNFASTCIIALSLKFRSKCIITINFI